MPISEQDKAKVLEMIAVELIPAIRKMLDKKNILFNLHGAHQEGNMLCIYLANHEHQVEFALRQDWLMEPAYCYKQDRLGGFEHITNIVDKVKLRILRCVYVGLMTVAPTKYSWAKFEFSGTSGMLM